MIAIRRKTRETLRHERAVVLQQLAADASDTLEQRQLRRNRRVAKRLAADAQRRFNNT